jgi:hypothetical protein
MFACVRHTFLDSLSAIPERADNARRDERPYTDAKSQPHNRDAFFAIPYDILLFSYSTYGARHPARAPAVEHLTTAKLSLRKGVVDRILALDCPRIAHGCPAPLEIERVSLGLLFGGEAQAIANPIPGAVCDYFGCVTHCLFVLSS